MSRSRVLDVLDMPTDISLDGGIFEHTVAHLVDGAVLQHEVLRIAEQLLACQVAVHQPDVLRVPGQVLSVEHGVVDGDVLTLPERVLCQDLRVVNFHVLAILEHIFRVAFQPVDVDVLREHEGVGTLMQHDVLQSEAVHLPEGFIGIIDHHILQFYVFHLTEELRPVDGAVLHLQVVGVPDGRARAHSEVAVLDVGAVDVPPGIFAVELAIVGLHPLALLDARLSVGDGDPLQPQVVLGEQRALASKSLVFNQFHCFVYIRRQRYE